MTTFVQLHFLTPYPPSNPNRDDQGRPKEARVGGVPRLRLSSQSIKHAVRMSDLFKKALEGHIGTRTKLIGKDIVDHLVTKRGAEVKQAEQIAAEISIAFGKIGGEDKEDSKKNGKKDVAKHELSQLVFLSPEEVAFAISTADKMFDGEQIPKEKELSKMMLRKADGAVDIAMFGRMLADEEKFNRARFEREAAVQVGHAITTHKAISESDYFTAVDDLKMRDGIPGAGHLDSHGFGSGIYYLYVCLNCDLLLENLVGDVPLARKGAETLVQALATTGPKGKQNSHANHPFATYIRAEVGTSQPRDLTGAFFAPVAGDDLEDSSIKMLEEMVGKFEYSYGPTGLASKVMNVPKSEGRLQDIVSFVGEAVASAGKRDG